MRRSRLTVALSVGVAVGLTAAGLAGAAVQRVMALARTGTAVGTCSNPVLDRDLTGWGAHNNGAPPTRVAVQAHVVADHGYFQSQANGANPEMYLPQKLVTPGETWTFAMDTWVYGPAANVSARMQVDWYNASSGYLGHSNGVAVPVASSTEERWTRVASDFAVPVNAARANVTARLEAPAGMAWTSTACDYQLAGLAPQPTASPTVSPNPTVSPTVSPTTSPTASPTPTNSPAPSDTAAGRYNWGAPVWSDDFNGTAPSASWGLYNSPGHQHGNRLPENCQVSNGTLKLVSEPNLDTCGMAHQRVQTHGRWEARVRSTGSGWMSLFIIWPDPGNWPANGEYDWREHGAGAACYTGFLHYPGHTPKVQEQLPNSCAAGGTSQWHNVAFEWSSTRMAGWVDGVPWYEFNCAAVEDLCRMPAGHLTFQNDNQGSAPGNSAITEVDWVRGWDL